MENRPAEIYISSLGKILIGARVPATGRKLSKYIIWLSQSESDRVLKAPARREVRSARILEHSGTSGEEKRAGVS
jgi:hypothetical protein